MPDLFHKSDIEMTIDVLRNISEVMQTEMQRRGIDEETVAHESGIFFIWLREIIHLDGTVVSLRATLTALDWLTVSMEKPSVQSRSGE